MYTREEFEAMRVQKAQEMAQDAALQKDALDVLLRADQHNWLHQTTWLGEPLLQTAQDMFAVQDIMWRTRPRFVVECGVAWGGSSLFLATLLQTLGGEAVIGIDVYVPDDLRQRLASKGSVSERIELHQASSIDPATVELVAKRLGGCRDVLVILDSHHTHEHVLQELRLYSPFVGPGQYLICGDTILDHIPVQTHRPRPWGPGNSPKSALDAFLAEQQRFEVDQALENKLLFTCSPGGYLRARA
ncbi:MAG: hypothetical protein A2051_10210 [Desulfovibrionales bacterium GWA2_65_9]|nr:MAG: hypothetical protein A2051_10210 [Desulfovibrionales bacterium GWA2_65_9]